MIIVGIYVIFLTKINIINVYPYLILSTIIIERVYREYINFYLKKLNLIEVEEKWHEKNINTIYNINNDF